ncbi:hypothetical protein F9C28_07840 [Shimwellia pseudoproteus]|uniref:hypothetical protein n=1 Tax=Shimwellia pseudoproteus TaxID=570012 RepID=UPI0018EC8ED3|nr:hypothetical protein [Shimwellia pseudoproteus]MBJ3814837.1 hypothetical protein [Shimwellia pseudoproteus]
MNLRSAVLLTTLLLAGCSSASMTQVHRVNALPVPIVTADNSLHPSDDTLQHYYQDSAQQINRLSQSLKDDYLRDIHGEDVMNPHSEARQVFAALTHLGDLAAMNAIYLQQQNIQGLEVINRELVTLARR